MRRPDRAGRWLLGAALGALALALAAALLGGYAVRVLTADHPASDRPLPGSSTPVSGLVTVPLTELPGEAAETITRIDARGPFPYRKDGSVFANAEGLLPERRHGYYREYTVRTPSATDRGARRVVAGADGDLYYTSDHYASFRQVLR